MTAQFSSASHRRDPAWKQHSRRVSRSSAILRGTLVVLCLATTPVPGVATGFVLPGQSQTGERLPATFTRDIAPIFFEHCAPCHRPAAAPRPSTC